MFDKEISTAKVLKRGGERRFGGGGGGRGGGGGKGEKIKGPPRGP